MKLTGSVIAATALGAVGGLLVGLVVAPKSAAASQPPVPAPPPPTVPVQDVSSTGSLNSGWMYFITVIDGAGAGALGVGKKLLDAGFVDPGTKHAPIMRDGPGRFTTLAIFSGVTGTPVPASTPALTWASVLGSPEPEVLTT